MFYTYIVLYIDCIVQVVTISVLHQHLHEQHYHSPQHQIIIFIINRDSDNVHQETASRHCR